MKFLSTVFFLLVVATSSIGCDNMAASDGGYQHSQPPKQYIVIIDSSASRTPEMLAEAKQFVVHVVNNLSFGDRIALMGMKEIGLSGKAKRWQKVMPLPTDSTYISSHDREVLSRDHKGAEMVLDTFFDTKLNPKIMHTDIFTTMLVAGEIAHDAEDRQTVLVLLSDMLQSDGKFEMAGQRRMPQATWISSQKQAGLLPNLSGACVLIVGADATTVAGAKIRDFWKSYFTETGATLSSANYRSTPPSSEVNFCK